MPTTRLAAIMFTDIVGYTAMMQENREQAMQAVRLYEAHLKDNIVKHEGELLQTFGDGSLSIFDSASAAVQCAKELQEAIRDTVPLRIGIHLGEITIDREHTFGDGVNIASRIESMGVAGAVLMSNSIRRQIKNKPAFELKSLGTFAFKNVAEPVEVFALANEGFTIPKRAKMQGKGKPLRTLGTRSLFKLGSVGFLVMLLGAALFWFFSARGQQDQSTVSEEIRTSRMAVLPFENKTGEESLDILGDMAADWIVQGLMEMPDMKVVTFDNVKDHIEFAGSSGSQMEFAKRTGAEKLIRGRFYLEKDQLTFQSQVVNVETGEIERALPGIVGPREEVSTLVVELQQKIMTSFMAEADIINEKISQNPPKLEAYRYYQENIEYFFGNPDQSISLLKKSIEADSSFFWAYGFLGIQYRNIGQHAQADSTLKLVESRIGVEKLNGYERSWYLHFQAVIKKDYMLAYELVLKILARDPKNFIAAIQASFFAHYLNQPQQVVEISQEFDPTHVPMEYPVHARWFRHYAHALYRLGRYDLSLEVSRWVIPKLRTRLAYYDRRSEVFVAQEQADSLEALIRDMQAHQQPANEILDEHLYIAERYGVRQVPDQQQEWASKAIAWAKAYSGDEALSDYHLGYAHYMAADFEKALAYFDKPYAKSPPSAALLTRMGCTYAQLGQAGKAQEMIRELGNRYRENGSAWRLADQARIYSILGEKEQAVDVLRQAIDVYYFYNPGCYREDIMFVPLQGYPPFEELVKPKG